MSSTVPRVAVGLRRQTVAPFLVQRQISRRQGGGQPRQTPAILASSTSNHFKNAGGATSKTALSGNFRRSSTYALQPAPSTIPPAQAVNNSAIRKPFNGPLFSRNSCTSLFLSFVLFTAQIKFTAAPPCPFICGPESPKEQYGRDN